MFGVDSFVVFSLLGCFWVRLRPRVWGWGCSPLWWFCLSVTWRLSPCILYSYLSCIYIYIYSEKKISHCLLGMKMYEEWQAKIQLKTWKYIIYQEDTLEFGKRLTKSNPNNLIFLLFWFLIISFIQILSKKYFTFYLKSY